MAAKSTFRLQMPSDRQVETYTVQLADGTTVTRTVDQLQRHPSSVK